MGMLKVTENVVAKKSGKTMGYMGGWRLTDRWMEYRETDGQID